MTVTSVADRLAYPDRPIGIFGGTFDPIHNAHLRVALDALEALQLSEIRFIPSHRPPHRAQPGADPQQRLAMLQRALVGQPGFIADARELRRSGPSYMFDTLTSLRHEQSRSALCLLLGVDAFHDFSSWHRWREITNIAHLVVLQRPGFEQALNHELQAWVAERRLHQADDLCRQPQGGVLCLPVTQLAISATQIRRRLAQRRSPRYLLPEAVHNYIHQHQLYGSTAAK